MKSAKKYSMRKKNTKNRYSLDFLQFKKAAATCNVIPIYREIVADMETPVSAFMKIARSQRYACLLESVEGGERWGRYSFIVCSPSKIMSFKNGEITVKSGSAAETRYKSDSPFEEIRKLLGGAKPMKVDALPGFWGGVVGYASYDMVRYIEKLGKMPEKDIDLPSMTFLEAKNIVVFDHLKHSMKMLSCVDLRQKKISREIYQNACDEIEKISRALKTPLKHPPRRAAGKKIRIKKTVNERLFKKMVLRAKKYINSGDIIQVVLSQRFDVKTTAQPFDIYRALRIVNPSPYMYYLKLDGMNVIGSSPEILVKKVNDLAVTKPIAGTRRRGKNNEEDEHLIAELSSDPKERAEHIMLVDLGRNDLSRVCVQGSVKTSELMSIEKYSHVIHMVSSVTGKLKKNCDAIDLFKACFPAGTVSGAPKIRAMQIIDELEPVSRGLYAGSVGYFSYGGDMDTAITIRTIIFENGTAHIQAGAGIVADSSPDKEYIETLNKAGALFGALNLAAKIREN